MVQALCGPPFHLVETHLILVKGQLCLVLDKLLVVYEGQPPIPGEGRVVMVCLPCSRIGLLVVLGTPDLHLQSDN